MAGSARRSELLADDEPEHRQICAEAVAETDTRQRHTGDAQGFPSAERAADLAL